MKYQKCNNCNGSGTILDHMHPPHAGQRPAGQGVSVCPSCNGSGNNGALDLSSQKYSGKSPGEIQGEKIGEGCVTVLFSIGPYLIVFYALSKSINFFINTLSSTYVINIPEWFPITVILIVFGAALFYKKYIGRMAVLSIVILIGTSYLLNDENKKHFLQKTAVQSKIGLLSPQKIKSSIRSYPISNCTTCKTNITELEMDATTRQKIKNHCTKYKKFCAANSITW
jgi:hypothetical protein